MKLIHTTFERNRESILDTGICVSFSTGALRRVWFHTKRMNGWAERHVASRHRGKLRDVIHMTVNIPADWIRWHGRGLCYVDRDVPPSHIESIEEARG